ncbi:hypothetical protein H632_c906p1 [Helicosporidium sp. ATCC 50920]|nr:hypothetical protein H632_c906p1 [Helicosporidium sp. ATCC 50920]|eukprot:KDD75044.1 hypothetical protein H632_c906p1 [Helicosporidium sp. ATCC 50920]
MSWKSALAKNVHELREFVLKNYSALKKANPELPILVREASGVKARLTARFGTFGGGLALKDMGKEMSKEVEGLSETDVSKMLEALVKAPAK